MRRLWPSVSRGGRKVTTVDKREDKSVLSRLFGDSPQVAILVVLLRDHELTTRQLVARTGYEPDLLQVAIAKLESEAVVEATQSGCITCWKLDRDSPLARSLVDLHFTDSERRAIFKQRENPVLRPQTEGRA